MHHALRQNTHYHVETATSIPAKLDNYAVRSAVWRESTGFGATVRYELDERDGIPEVATLFNVVHQDNVVGAARVVHPNEELARRDGSKTGLHLGQTYDDSPLAGMNVAEISRVVLLKEHRGTLAAPLLLDGILGWLRAEGVTMVVGSANVETNVPGDAVLVMRALDARGLLRRDLWLQKKPGEGDVAGSAPRPFYKPEERRLGMAGRDDKLRLPGTLKLYARFGARYIGEPRFNETFGLYEVPLAAPVPERSLLRNDAPPSLDNAA